MAEIRRLIAARDFSLQAWRQAVLLVDYLLLLSLINHFIFAGLAFKCYMISPDQAASIYAATADKANFIFVHHIPNEACFIGPLLSLGVMLLFFWHFWTKAEAKSKWQEQR